MKIMETRPSPSNYGLKEIFSHPNFIAGNDEERNAIMLKSAQWNYDTEIEFPWDRYFGFDLTSLLSNKAVLDLGCFTGGKSIAWAERYGVREMYGIDTSDIFITAARKFAEKKGIEAKFSVSFAEELPFQDNMFDAILSVDVFEHVQRLKDVLLECKRVLRKDGMLFIVFPGYFHPFEHHLNCVTRMPFIHYFSSGEELVDIYNEIIDERGDEANWYKREIVFLRPWERCNEINGTTHRRFRYLINKTGWDIYHVGRLPLGQVGGRLVSNIAVAKKISSIIQPLVSLPYLEEILCQPIVYILKPINE